MVQVYDDVFSTIANHDKEGSLLFLEAIAEERRNARVAATTSAQFHLAGRTRNQRMKYSHLLARHGNGLIMVEAVLWYVLLASARLQVAIAAITAQRSPGLGRVWENFSGALFCRAVKVGDGDVMEP